MANPPLLRCDVLRTSVTCYVCGFTTDQIHIIQNPIKIRDPYVAMILLLVIKLWHHRFFVRWRSSSTWARRSRLWGRTKVALSHGRRDGGAGVPTKSPKPYRNMVIYHGKTWENYGLTIGKPKSCCFFEGNFQSFFCLTWFSRLRTEYVCKKNGIYSWLIVGKWVNRTQL